MFSNRAEKRKTSERESRGCIALQSSSRRLPVAEHHHTSRVPSVEQVSLFSRRQIWPYVTVCLGCNLTSENCKWMIATRKNRKAQKVFEKMARLEAELRSPGPSSSSCLRSLPVEKDLKIQQMEREMEELKRQRDIAHSQLELERKSHKAQK